MQIQSNLIKVNQVQSGSFQHKFKPIKSK